ncbi:CCA tRNA nucleotidyltransferase [Thermodesulfitimonas autotrophica]|uniref:CCA tRNA nucleotidyltransferase n=1 Tax=Thermodesulfitimonas autotrophica TaxID=1894989 RepID=UPI002FE41FE9
MFPPPVVKVLQTLEESGFQAFVVGGAVRDILLGRAPREYDVATDARPEELLRLAQRFRLKAYPKGAAFGVISFLVDGMEIEVATFRAEVYGADAHRPEKVDFLSRLEEDLARRDFTVNAMAFDRQGRLYDPFGGREDLSRGILRAVGDPDERFREDALRPFRACRFAAEYGFAVDAETRAAIIRARDRVAGLSVERIREELERILLSPHPARGFALLRETGLLATRCRARTAGKEETVPVLPELARLCGVPQNPRYHAYDVWEHTMRVVELIPPDTTLRWAALLHDIAKGMPGVRTLNKRGELADYRHEQVGSLMAKEILDRLRVSTACVRRVVWLIRRHMNFPAAKEVSVVKWLRHLAPEFKDRQELASAVAQLLTLREADLRGGKVRPEGRLAENERLRVLVADVLMRVPFYPADLALSGRVVARYLGEGPQVKRVLDDLLRRVQEGSLPNEAEALEKALSGTESYKRFLVHKENGRERRRV